MSVITNDTATALYSTLTGGTALTSLLAGTASVYRTQAPDGATMPYVVFSLQSGVSENVTSAQMDNNIWFVRAYTLGSAPSAAANVFAAVDALLHRRSLTVGARNLIWCARESTLELVETLPDKTHVWMCGGFYRVRTSGE